MGQGHTWACPSARGCSPHVRQRLSALPVSLRTESPPLEGRGPPACPTSDGTPQSLCRAFQPRGDGLLSPALTTACFCPFHPEGQEVR